MAQRIIVSHATRRLIRPSPSLPAVFSTQSSPILNIRHHSHSYSHSYTQPTENTTTTTRCSVQYFTTSTITLSSSSSSEKADTKTTTETTETSTRPEHLGPNAPEWDQRIDFSEFDEGEEIPVVQLPPMDMNDDESKTLASPEIHELADQIIHMKLKDVVTLTQKVQDHFGFEEDDYDDDDAGGAGAGAGEEAEEEQTAFELKLTGFDAKSKIKVIKEIRTITGLGLKEAKELVEGAPKVVKGGMKKEDAEELKAKLEAVGGKVEIA